MKILLTGSTGYIGRRLAYRLLKDSDVDLRLLVRNPQAVDPFLAARCEVVTGNTLDIQSLHEALRDVNVAYYLVHSMASGADYSRLDRLSAANFRDACNTQKVERVIYLGGLGDKVSGSKHLKSRIETGEILSGENLSYHTLWFRAGVIIGSGSASFEIIRNLVQKLPVMLTPSWVHVKTEPIAIKDVMEYLYRAKDNSIDHDAVIDIGSGPMTFGEMLSGCAEVMELKRVIIPVPFFSPGLSSYWLILFTPVPLKIAGELVKGLKSTTTRLNDNAEKYFSEIKPVSYSDAIGYAIDEIECNSILSRWSDSLGSCTLDDVGDVVLEQYVNTITVQHRYNGTRDNTFHAIERIGGHRGWYRFHLLWKIRGLVDRLAGGFGTGRGRRDPESLRIGDSLDFWKVVDLIPDTRLLLYSEMKLPGRGWLEFMVDDKNITTTAYFIPAGLTGRLYWYFFYPFHVILFHFMTKKLSSTGNS